VDVLPKGRSLFCSQSEVTIPNILSPGTRGPIKREENSKMDECDKRGQNVIIKTYGFSLKWLYLNSDFSSWGVIKIDYSSM